MEEVKFNIKTSEGENVSFFVPSCGSSFFAFPPEPYQENPEFTNCWVLGSGSTTKSQIILRAQPQGHKKDPTPHINVDYAYWDEGRKKRIRVNDIKTLEMAEWVEVTQEFNGKEFKQIINLEELNSN